MKTSTRRIIIFIGIILLITLGNFKTGNPKSETFVVKKLDVEAYHFNQEETCFKTLTLDKNKNLFDKYTNHDFMFAISKSKNIYYIDKDGVIQTGFVKIGDDTYYFDEEGIMQKGDIDIDGKNYLFDIDTGKLEKKI